MTKSDDSLANAAILALLMRHAETWWERAHLKKRMARDKKRVAELTALIADCDTSFRVFGHDVKDKDVWAALIEKHVEALKPHLAGLNEAYPLVTAEDADEVEGQQVLPPPEQKPIHELVLERLKEVGNAGSKAAPIRVAIQATLGREIHEKTVGMTMYRLLKQGLVRRDGHTWFYVPQKAEAKDPGVSAPGLFNREDKEGEEL